MEAFRILHRSRQSLRGYSRADLCQCGYLSKGLSSHFKHLSGCAPMKIDLTDLTAPHTWYPSARKKKRRVFMHIGPTNSGKTFSALKRLQECETGIYCGPLRLLAWEVSEKMNNANVPCNLITGQERKEIKGAQHNSVTVEMADLAREYDCAVIDEIQMIGCPTRGFSFTRALLGLVVNELHLCGDASAVDLVQNILVPTGDIVEITYYNRLSPLVVGKTSLQSYSRVESGDCIVTFSRRSIYKIKAQIETLGLYRCSVVYGSLPPQTRAQQAVQFNTASSGFDVLVASDAIGMGLNLNIRRIIFSSMEKFDGFRVRSLSSTEIKQIAGRAGRYRSRFPEGEVTCLKEGDLPLLHESLEAPTVLVKAAGLFPSSDLLALYSKLHPNLTFATLLEDFSTKAQLSSYYTLCNSDVMMAIATMLDDLPLSFQDRYIFCCSPVDIEDYMSYRSLVEFATAYVKEKRVMLAKYFTPATICIPKTPPDLEELESIHKVLELYVWLSFHLEHAFTERELANEELKICCMLIDEALKIFGERASCQKRLRQLRYAR